MKKILFIGLCCLCLCGCGKGNELSFSELTIEPSFTGNGGDIHGTVQNNTSKKITAANVIFILKNGDIKKECSTSISLEPNEIKELDQLLLCEGNIENYKIVNKKINYIIYDD